MIRIGKFQDINLTDDAVITVQGEGFDFSGEPVLEREIYLTYNRTINAFWKEISEVANEFRNKNLCPVLSIKMLMTEVLYDQK